jgi:pilus assembly protein CpaC
MNNKKVRYILAAFIILVFSSAALAAIPVEVFIGKGTIVNLKEPSKRVSLSNPEVADLNLITPTEIVINGKKIGSTNLIVWDNKGKATFFDVTVIGDINLNKLLAQIKEVAPSDDITVEFAKDTIVLSGKAVNQKTVDKVVNWHKRMRLLPNHNRTPAKRGKKETRNGRRS